MSKMSFIVENGCGLECVPKRPRTKLCFTSFQNHSIGRVLKEHGHKTLHVPYSKPSKCMTDASEDEIIKAAATVGTPYLEICEVPPSSKVR